MNQSEQYYERNLKPEIEKFFRQKMVDCNRSVQVQFDPEVDKKAWSYCDMMFTAFLGGQTMCPVLRKQDSLCYDIMQQWFKSLEEENQNKRQWFQSNKGQPLFPSTRFNEADSILQHLDLDFLKSHKTNVPGELFCMCLNYIVHKECEQFQKAHSKHEYMEQWSHVVRAGIGENCLFDTNKFLMKAEDFFYTNVGVMFMFKHAKLRRNFVDQPQIQRLCITHAQSTTNPYIIRKR
jgi:hypothetical protein